MKSLRNFGLFFSHLTACVAIYASHVPSINISDGGILSWDDANGSELQESSDLINWYSTGVTTSPLQLIPLANETKLFFRLFSTIFDRDGDGVADDIDDFPNDPSEAYDSDLDGIGDNADKFRYNSTEAVDSDNDGVGANGDLDDNDPTVLRGPFAEFSFIGTNNHDFSSYIMVPVAVSSTYIPTFPFGIDMTYLSEGTALIAGWKVIPHTIGGSEFGQSKVTVKQTSAFSGYLLKVRYFRYNPNSPLGVPGYSGSGAVLSIDGDDLVNSDITAVAETSMAVSTQNGYQLRAWKERKVPLLEFSFIGTTNHNFASYLTLPTTVIIDDITTAPLNSDGFISTTESTEVASFIVPNEGTIGGSQYGKSSVTLSQTTALENHNLIVQFFRHNTDGLYEWVASGASISVDGDILALGDVTATAPTGMGVGDRTGFMVRVRKDQK